MALSTQPYKGARDFFPEDKRLQKYMFDTWRTVAERYGYEEYDAPILEPTDIYLAKGNKEIIDEQTYTFQDRGGRSVTIRTEMTPTVSRLVASKRQVLPYPLRWYSIPNLWRYERPQKGRLREFWQLNVDIFGVDTVSAEIEMIMIIVDIFKQFDATEDMYEISVNHRGLINYLLSDYLELDNQQLVKMAALIDRMHKIDRSDLINRIDEILTTDQKEHGNTEKLLAVLDAKSIEELPSLAREQSSTKELHILLDALKMSGISNVHFDSTLMRGFDYYTGVVFEVFDTDPENRRSLLGGGRYDGLIGLFGVDPVPSVGFAWGDVTLISFLTLHNLLPKMTSETHVFVIPLDVEEPALRKLVQKLRQSGINIAIGINGKKVGDQIKLAEKKYIEYVFIIGKKELDSKTVTIKHLPTAEEVTLSVDDAIEKIKSTLQIGD